MSRDDVRGHFPYDSYPHPTDHEHPMTAPTPRDWREGMYRVVHGDGTGCWHRDRRKVERRALPRREPRDVEAARAALLHLLGDATSSTAVEDLEAAVRAESAETLAALREALIGLDEAWRWVEEHYPKALVAMPSLAPFERARAALAATPAEDEEGRT